MAAMLDRLRRSREESVKKIVNEALRQGLRQMASPTRARRPFRTKSVSLGTCLLGNVNNISEALAVAEDESFK